MAQQLTRTVNLAIRVNAEERDLLRKLEHSLGMTRSQVLRLLIRQECERRQIR